MRPAALIELEDRYWMPPVARKGALTLIEHSCTSLAGLRDEAILAR
jgi:hypothetical protein